MARMITSKSPSGGEKVVFEALRKGPRDWMVMHSVRVPAGGNRNPREIDFVVGVPDQAVICLEVKGGEFYVRDDGRWCRQGDQPVESPLSQAESAMWALKGCMRRELSGDALRHIEPGDAVVFTDATWPEGVKNPPGYEFYDCSVMQNDGQLVHKLSEYATRLSKRKSSPNPTTAMLTRLRNLFFPEVRMKYGWALGPRLNYIDRELLEFTEEQHQALLIAQNLDGSINNNRVLFGGGAGTGKTMLAIQLAQLRREAGDRVGVVCHSGVLGQWLRRQLESGIPAVGTVLGALSRAAPETPGARSRLDRQWQEAIDQQKFEEAHDMMENLGLTLVDVLERSNLKWDYLIVDELQHFADPLDLHLLDMALEGGLARGKWAMFGDFSFQDMVATRLRYSNERGGALSPGFELVDPQSCLAELCGVSDLKDACVHAVPLMVNCRNTRSIAEATARVVGHDAAEVHPSRVEGPDVVYRYFGDSDGDDILAEELFRLQNDGVNPGQVAIVFGIGSEVPDFGGRRLGPWRLRKRSGRGIDAGPEDGGAVDVYTNLHFAGMERDTVIMAYTLTSEFLSGPEVACSASDLFACDMYLSMTRAKGALIVIAHESMRCWIER